MIVEYILGPRTTPMERTASSVKTIQFEGNEKLKFRCERLQGDYVLNVLNKSIILYYPFEIVLGIVKRIPICGLDPCTGGEMPNIYDKLLYNYLSGILGLSQVVRYQDLREQYS